MRLIVDAMNVIGSRGDGWWLDRDAAVRRLIAALARQVAEGREQVTVVLDGRIPEGAAEGVPSGLEVLDAGRRGRDAADDRIVELIEADARPWEITVVTSDGRLGERVRGLGARVVGVRALLRTLGSP